MQRPLLTAALLVLGSVNLVHAEAGKSFVDVVPGQSGQGGTIDESNEPLVIQTRTLARVWLDEAQTAALTPAVDSNIIFMHRCSTGSPCTVARAGSNDSRTVPDHSTIVSSGTHTLSAFSRSDAVWQSAMACMRDTFGPFGVTITDVDPGSANHYEIMVGGSPGQVGMDAGVGGVSPATCGTIPSSVVFVFDVWGNNYEEICSTAAQEIAHSWSLDHSTEPSDPMTYFSYSGRRHFMDAPVACGSDCVNGTSPFGDPCTGQTHVCACGGNTQNTFQMVRGLFGDGTPTPPVVAFTKPMNNERVQPGFAIATTVTDDSLIQKVDLFIDNQLVKSLTTKPYAFNAPTDMGMGNHIVKVVATDAFGTPGNSQITVTIGAPCEKPSDCGVATDTCVGGRCVPGSGVQGGLGTTCTDGTSCASGQCAAGDSGSVCVEPCTPGADECPGGFACLDVGGGNGVCYPGDDGGGCSTDGTQGGGSRPGAMIGLGLGFAALLFARRRRT